MTKAQILNLLGKPTMKRGAANWDVKLQPEADSDENDSEPLYAAAAGLSGAMIGDPRERWVYSPQAMATVETEKPSAPKSIPVEDLDKALKQAFGEELYSKVMNEEPLTDQEQAIVDELKHNLVEGLARGIAKAFSDPSESDFFIYFDKDRVVELRGSKDSKNH